MTTFTSEDRQAAQAHPFLELTDARIEEIFLQVLQSTDKDPIVDFARAVIEEAIAK